MTPRLVLFDIDGTLLLTGGAGKRAMDRAFEELFGVPGAFAGTSMAGRTDRYLIEQALRRHGVPVTDERLDRFRQRYLERLAETIHEPGHGRKGVMPGVASLLDALERIAGVHAALLTGNYEGGAHVKLTYYDLWGRFPWGAFGDEHAERDDLARAAIAAAGDRGIALATPAHAVVIGDTPFDVECARAAGARVVAVATGSHSAAALRGCAPDLVVETLDAIDDVLDVVLR